MPADVTKGIDRLGEKIDKLADTLEHSSKASEKQAYALNLFTAIIALAATIQLFLYFFD